MIDEVSTSIYGAIGEQNVVDTLQCLLDDFILINDFTVSFSTPLFWPQGKKYITDWSAYQYFEDDRKGTLTAGKLADLVVLDKNPLKVNVEEIKEIQVLETIKEGKSVYKKL